MKTILVTLAAAGLSGCAVYPAPAYDVYGNSPPYVVEQPVYIYGSGVYRSGDSRHIEPRDYDRPRPRAMPPSSPRPLMQAPRPGYGARDRDRDRDGIPDRLDSDRDGDGVPDRYDRRPNDPRHR